MRLDGLLIVCTSARQFLVSRSRASVLNNLVAIALTLAGPKLWIQLKAFSLFAFDIYARRRQQMNRRSTSDELPLAS